MTFVLILGGTIIWLLFYLPVYLPLLLSFLIKSPTLVELKWALRILSFVCLLIAIIPPPGLRTDFGDDVAGSMAGARHNFPLYISWFWGGSLYCAAFTIGAALLLKWIRRQLHLNSGEGETGSTARPDGR
jgi:hypothetical protein